MNASGIVREMRRRLALSQAEFARLVSTSQPTVSQYESGRKVPSVKTLNGLADSCGMRIEAQLHLASHGATTEALARALGAEASVPNRVRLICQFIEDFRASQDTSFMLMRPPGLEPLVDALVAATVEHVCLLTSSDVPKWTRNPDRFLSTWVFLSPTVGLRASALANSAPAFANRGVFISRESLVSV